MNFPDDIKSHTRQQIFCFGPDGLLRRHAPGVKESAGKKKGGGSTGHGNSYLARVLGEAAVGAARTDTLYPDVAGSGDKEAKAKLCRIEIDEVAVALGPPA